MITQDIHFEMPKRQSYGTFFTPDAIGRTAAVLFIPGYAAGRTSNHDYAAALTEQVGIICMTAHLFDYSDDQRDPSDTSFRKQVNDLEAMYDFLREQPSVDSERIGLVAASYGGYLAALLCNSRNPYSVVLRSPGLYEDKFVDRTRKDITRQEIDSYREQVTPQTKNLAFDGIARVPGQVLVVESELDRTVPSNVAASFAQVAMHGSRYVLVGAHHRLEGEQRTEFFNILVEWARNLQSPGLTQFD